MLKIEKFVTPSPEQWEITIEGMRNAMNSWDRMDSHISVEWAGAVQEFDLGENDKDLAMRLNKGGAPHAKYRRMLPVHVTVTAPLFWWKEFETYRIGVASNPSDIEFNSCSTMHKIHAKPFHWGDFSLDELTKGNLCTSDGEYVAPDLKPHYKHLMNVVSSLNNLRDLYLETKDKRYWRCMIESLPSSYNQKRTIYLNYQVLYEIYEWRRNHKLDEWHTFCHWIEELPYSELIIGEVEE